MKLLKHFVKLLGVVGKFEARSGLGAKAPEVPPEPEEAGKTCMSSSGVEQINATLVSVIQIS